MLLTLVVAIYLCFGCIACFEPRYAQCRQEVSFRTVITVRPAVVSGERDHVSSTQESTRRSFPFLSGYAHIHRLFCACGATQTVPHRKKLYWKIFRVSCLQPLFRSGAVVVVLSIRPSLLSLLSLFGGTKRSREEGHGQGIQAAPYHHSDSPSTCQYSVVSSISSVLANLNHGETFCCINHRAITGA